MSNNGFQIHPAANAFRMMTADELQELAASIEANGLRDPIMMDADGKVLIDGRNRLEACKLANVEPRFAKLPAGSDPVAYIADKNVMRRDLTKGQKAMALAMMYPEPEKGGRGKLSRFRDGLDEPNGTFKNRLSHARAVLHYSRPLAENVRDGMPTLDEALAKVKQEQQYQHSDEAKLDRLRQVAPDLAEQVNEERLKVNEAIAALQAREQEMRRVCEDARRAAQDIVGQFASNALAIKQGVDNGEPIVIPANQRKQLESGYALLFKTLGWKE